MLALAFGSSLIHVAVADPHVPGQGHPNTLPSVNATVFKSRAQAQWTFEQAVPALFGHWSLRTLVVMGSAGVALVGCIRVFQSVDRKQSQPGDPNGRPCASCTWKGSSTFLKTAAHIFFVVVAYMAVGPSLLLLNKHIMQSHRFSYPLALCSSGVLAALLFSQAAVRLGFAEVNAKSTAAIEGVQWFRVALPIGAAKSVTLATGNAVYLHLGLGFIQMLKAFSPAIVFAVMGALGVRRPTPAATACVCVIILGTALVVRGELQASVIGLLLMLVSESCEAIGLVLTQKMLQDCKLSVMESLYIVSPPIAFCLCSLALSLEVPAMVQSGDWMIMVDNAADFALTGCLGLLVHWVTMMLVQATSSLFVKILNIVRCMCLVFVGVALYGEAVSPLECTGYVITLLGFTGYTCLQASSQAAAVLEHGMERSSPPPTVCAELDASGDSDEETVPLKIGDLGRSGDEDTHRHSEERLHSEERRGGGSQCPPRNGGQEGKTAAGLGAVEDV